MGRESPQPEPDRLPQVEIVVPVRDEERDLSPGIRRLVAYLAGSFPFRAVVTIADNGSTDSTWAVAQALAAQLAGVGAVRLGRRDPLLRRREPGQLRRRVRGRRADHRLGAGPTTRRKP